MRRIAGVTILLALCSVAWGQQDVFITGTNAYTVLGRGIPWGNGAAAVNNNFVFSPLNPNTQVCLYVTNNNPTNSHSFTVNLLQAGDPQVKTFANAGSKWKSSGTVQAMPVTVTAAQTVGIYFNVTAAAVLTAQFTGSATQAGSPDTADIFAVQTTAGGCGIANGTPVTVSGPFNQGVTLTSGQKNPVLIGGLNQSTGQVTVQQYGANGATLLDGDNSTPPRLLGAIVTKGQFNDLSCLANGNSLVPCTITAVAAAPWGGGTNGDLIGSLIYTNILESGMQVQQGQQVSFDVQASTVNPGAAVAIVHSFNVPVSTVQLAYKSAILSCSAACELKLIRTSARGSTCTAVSVNSFQLTGSSRPTANASDVAETACGTQPTVGETIEDLFLAAGIPQQIDLSGLIAAGNSAAGGGLEVVNVSSLTGTATASLLFVEQPK
jgi:hypothetical protein